MSVNVYEFLLQSAERSPDRVCISSAEDSFTYAEICGQVEALRQSLQDLGLQANTGVGCVAENGPAFLVLLFAVLACGAVAVPIAPETSAGEINSIAESMSLSAFVVQKKFAQLYNCEASSSDGKFSLRIRPPLPGFCSHIKNAAVIRPTSGTTARSKGVVLSHETIFERTAAAQQALRLRSGEDVVCSVLPMSQHFVVSLLTYVRFGIEIAVSKTALADAMFEAIAKRSCTVLYAAPLHFALLAADTSSAQLQSLRLAISTSSALSLGVAERFFARFRLPIRQVYGIIELGLPLGDLPPEAFRGGSVGTPLPGFRATLIAADGTEGRSGELFLYGPGMFDGYLSPPEKSTVFLTENGFSTGDLAERSEDGSIRILGRKKSVIITAGNKVFPEEVESILESHPAIRASRVFSEPHHVLGEMVVAEAELHADMQADEALLRQFCRTRLSSYKIPQRIDFVSSILKTNTGKVKRSVRDL